MNKDELILSKIEKRNDFLLGCLFNRFAEGYDEAVAIVEKSADSAEVIRNILESATMRGTQVYAELSKDQPGHAERVMRDLDSWYESYSDAGGLKIGSAGMSIIIPNGRGDGPMHWTEVGKNCFNDSMLDFWTSVSGKIDVYDYDCSGGEIVKTLEGRYGIYRGYGLVVFERWGDAQ